jgi:hypothetical protein
LRFAQRARAAAASFARVAGDILRRPRRPPPRRPRVGVVEPPPKRVESRCSSAPICFLMERACVSW